MPRPLRWIFLVLAVGTLVSSGIYARILIAEGGGMAAALRSATFLMIGLFSTLMYGENRK